MSTTVGARAAPGLRVNGGRLALAGAVAAAGVLGSLGGDDGGAGSELLILMRFMAGVKAAMALGAVVLVWWRMGAVVLVWWRMGAPVRRGAAAAYVMATAVMAVGPGLIWDMRHMALGAAAVHGGLSALLVVGWLDRAGWNGMVGDAVARRRKRLVQHGN